MSVSKNVLPWVAALKPYQPGKPVEELERELGIRGSVKLASNENPMGASARAVAAAREALVAPHLYPDAGTFRLRQALGAHHGVDASDLVLGNGSNEVLTLLVRALASREHNVVVSRYAFVAYTIVTKAAGVELRVAKDRELAHDPEALVAACDANTRLLFVANPNNPTGTLLNEDAIAWLVKNTPEHVTLVLDEAYVEYAEGLGFVSGLAWRQERENLVVTRTFSKAYGLASLRCGYGIAPPPLADALHRIREPFNVNAPAQAAALAALDDQDFVARSVALNASERERVKDALLQMGLQVLPGATNFVLVEVPGGGPAVYDALLRRGVIVRPLVPYGLENHIRVSLGLREENDRFLEALRAVLAA